MLDINLFREEKGGNPELIRESQRRRYKDVSLVDSVIELDQEWRKKRFDVDQISKEFNKLNKSIATKRKAKEDASELQEQSKAMKKDIEALQDIVKVAEAKRDEALKKIGNLVHDSVPVNNDEAHNEVVRTFGTPRTKEDAKYNHVDLVGMLGIVDLEAGQAVAGGRGYYLLNYGVMLNQALISYGLQFLALRGYCPVHTPFFMRKNIMAETAQLSDFDEQLYKVSGEGDDKYLIATSEQTISSMHRQKWYEPRELPIKYAGYSSCFRKEAGSHGRDTLGIYRVHQFEKIEQFVLTSPQGNESWEAMEEMLKNAEDFYQSLGIPYHVVNIVSGELNDAAAKKFDLEASFPASQAFRELVSCSNCTDYQSRRLEVRMRAPKGVIDKEKVYVHMLNSTLSATERALCCLLENYQTADGVRVPEVLQPFMMGVKFMPFVNELDKKGRLQPRKHQIYDPLFNKDMYRVWYSKDASAGVKNSIEYLFRNMKLQKSVESIEDVDSMPEGCRQHASCDAVASYHDEVAGQGTNVLKFITKRENSNLYPQNEEEDLKVGGALDWYNDLTEGKQVSEEKMTGDILPQLEKWLEEGNKFLAGKAMTIADLLFGAECIEAKKANKNLLNEYKLTSKWFNKIAEPKMWK
ncbi:seryl--tRNA ligase [Chloropicon primus]|uniref:serine--tRNA ligase n=1 Tax=Chloropicon primus TaxID=1764295 RepID=A0A5B8MEP6_9CHLO|nr:seryl--tRNA ligase [Chloropicon primus]UPQ98131.1 seryl--tRNA ligase [Chloropicon primus]|mmetsp:Transcript_5979/g.17948  ORF Transcript_5979/g.17948 Transcript_5979/m.17948 type:complete len:637 (+) Transcript_5979:123-2033(+)|eukprot:QDZ18923.1 seryl--tRNA ligase [Chloropicon primus]